MECLRDELMHLKRIHPRPLENIYSKYKQPQPQGCKSNAETVRCFNVYLGRRDFELAS